ncbi:hypothetical protein PGQ11_010222 [Apiospora arundinis]|uniref:F-box domain-containing protein n=1 Tax=Apiospora arundinis TaxID=335852 RepID=A0ABR2I902_9PEZI
MNASGAAFHSLWQEGQIREMLFDILPSQDICNVRLASSTCCNLVTQRLFLRTKLTFKARTFMQQARVQALSRIGLYIEHLTFYFPHSDATFLPPLINESGKEIGFLYTPYTSMASVTLRPKCANQELEDLLTQQYPPLFHAATNVPSFIKAMQHMRNIRHLTIQTPGQNAKERYRRSIVDYALISLRISLERAPLEKLIKLSLSAVHPSAFLYLRHVHGFGCTPSASRRWRQIRKLEISVEAWDFWGPSPGLDHLKMITDYIRTFADFIKKLTFTWLGHKGPCPTSLAADPIFAPSHSSQEEVMSKPIRFRELCYLSLRNVSMDAPQVAKLMADNVNCVREFAFENIKLFRGSLNEALAPLMNSGHWACQGTGPNKGGMNVGMAPSTECITKRRRKRRQRRDNPTPMSPSTGRMAISGPIFNAKADMPTLLQPNVYHPPVAKHRDIPAVQREVEDAQRCLGNVPKQSYNHNYNNGSPTRVRFRLDGDDNHHTSSTVTMSTDDQSMSVPLFLSKG